MKTKMNNSLESLLQLAISDNSEVYLQLERDVTIYGAANYIIDYDESSDRIVITRIPPS